MTFMPISTLFAMGRLQGRVCSLEAAYKKEGALANGDLREQLASKTRASLFNKLCLTRISSLLSFV